jgi:hypothetical protein
VTILLPGQPVVQEKKLALDSAVGNPIDNGQYNEISSFEASQFNKLSETWSSHLGLRGKPTARYNCHGMTFASRRTGIYEATVVKQVIVEDGYVVINANDVLPGDVIIYYSSDGDVEHSGIVVSKIDSQLYVPQVLSKWGKFSEIIHWANQCPYTFSQAKYYRITNES